MNSFTPEKKIEILTLQLRKAETVECIEKLEDNLKNILNTKYTGTIEILKSQIKI